MGSAGASRRRRSTRFPIGRRVGNFNIASVRRLLRAIRRGSDIKDKLRETDMHQLKPIRPVEPEELNHISGDRAWEQIELAAVSQATESDAINFVAIHTHCRRRCEWERNVTKLKDNRCPMKARSNSQQLQTKMWKTHGLQAQTCTNLRKSKENVRKTTDF